jgi:hypothetical protein
MRVRIVDSVPTSPTVDRTFDGLAQLEDYIGVKSGITSKKGFLIRKENSHCGWGICWGPEFFSTCGRQKRDVLETETKATFHIFKTWTELCAWIGGSN